MNLEKCLQVQVFVKSKLSNLRAARIQLGVLPGHCVVSSVHSQRALVVKLVVNYVWMRQVDLVGIRNVPESVSIVDSLIQSFCQGTGSFARAFGPHGFVCNDAQQTHRSKN